MNNKKLMKMCFAFSIGLCLSGVVSAKPLEILSFKKDQLTSLENQQICQQLQPQCSSSKAFSSVKMNPSSIWVLANDQIVQFQKSQNAFKKQNTWRFKQLNQVDAEGETDQYKLFPKLFPMDQNRYAVALLNQRTEGYSGGGAVIQRADFIELKHTGQTHQFITDYPFYFSQMIRACFSEEEYESSEGHCHDLYDLNLDIRVIKPMHWQLRYSYVTQISPASDSGEKSGKYRRNIEIDLNQTPKQLDLPEGWNYSGQE